MPYFISIRATFSFFLMFYQMLFSPKMKRCAIITYKHCIYQLPNDLRLRILGNEEISGKCLNFI